MPSYWEKRNGTVRICEASWTEVGKGRRRQKINVSKGKGSERWKKKANMSHKLMGQREK